MTLILSTLSNPVVPWAIIIVGIFFAALKGAFGTKADTTATEVKEVLHDLRDKLTALAEKKADKE